MCRLSTSRLWVEAEHAVALPDPEPIVDGHVLVVPRKHVGTIYMLTAAEQKALWALVSEIRARLFTGLMPYGFSIGMKDALYGGSRTEHAAFHIIPRRYGDHLNLPTDLDWVIGDSAPAAER